MKKENDMEETARMGLEGWQGMINLALIIAKAQGKKEYQLPSISVEDLYDLKMILDGSPVVV